MNASAYRVLIVEDDALMREPLELAVSEHADLMMAASVRSMTAGRKWLNQHHADVMLVGSSLPDDAAIRLIHHATRRKQPVTSMLIAMDTNEAVMQALAAGAAGYVLVDTIAEKMTSAILDVLRGGTPISSSIACRLFETLPRRASGNEDAHTLTNHEVKVLEYLSMGFGRRGSADKLSISVRTIRSDVKRIYEKFAMWSSCEA